jgi:hypothetical protein
MPDGQYAIAKRMFLHWECAPERDFHARTPDSG